MAEYTLGEFVVLPHCQFPTQSHDCDSQQTSGAIFLPFTICQKVQENYSTPVPTVS